MGNLSKAKKDAAIIGTNNSSIVSKRSVEKLYSHDNEHQYLRYFVRKPQRRSPIINRGYWVRMQAVDFVVRSFLQEELGGKRKVVVNLGCGYDPLPFQCLSQKLGGDSEVLYVDIDYPDLMTIKASFVTDQPEIMGLLSDPRHYEKPEANVHFQSKEYLALGCDLRALDTLQEIFTRHGIADAAILFTAEVSLTYMDRDGVDDLVKWAAGLPDARFSILEQFLPDGHQHPFARTMLKHFNTLNTQLKSVMAYPTLEKQVERYSSRGWSSVTACDLLAFWTGISEEERKRVEAIEPFDEWEEFFLFCQHYFILYATNQEGKPGALNQASERWTGGQWSCFPAKQISQSEASGYDNRATIKCTAKWTGNRRMKRRCGAAASLDAENVVYHGGLAKARLNSALLITQDASANGIIKNAASPPEGRVYHTLTRISPGKAILIGGRSSPDKPLKDAYILEDGKWRRVQDMPEGRSRHSAVSIGDGKVLVFGGRGSGNSVLGNFLLWSEERGFEEIEFLDLSHKPKARFSAGFCWKSESSLGYLTGGMDQNGGVFNDAHEIEFSYDAENKPFLKGTRFSTDVRFGRMGHSLQYVDSCRALVIGGVAKDGLLASKDEILLLNTNTLQVEGIVDTTFPEDCSPLLVGHSVVDVGCNNLMICGGGGVCFSMGSCDNEGVWELSMGNSPSSEWHLIEEAISTATSESIRGVKTTALNGSISTPQDSLSSATAQQVPKVVITTASEFQKIITASLPVLIPSVDLGPCTTLWTPSYLTSKVGHDRSVSVHVASTTSMSFHHKNFKYSTMKFSDFMDAVESGSSNLYFRSLSANAPTSAPTNITTDFPTLADDFILPPQLELVKTNQHSSPLRISSAGVGMWLHYDAMANILCHIRGRKLLRLYPPSDVTKLSFPPGASTSTILDVFDTPSPSGTTPYDVEMNPGDVLYIPPLWLHAAKPLTPCVAVNVFFRGEMERDRWPEGRDVYANRDIKAYERGREKVRAMKREFEGLPEEVKKFYVSRLAEELMME